MIQYPKTPRIGRVDDLGWGKLTGVVSEKLDGSNVGVSFDNRGIHLQSRRHVLDKDIDPRFEDYVDLCIEMEDELYSYLGRRYILYGEWLKWMHRVYYTRLPGYLVVYDVYDKEEGYYLSTARREVLLDGLSLPQAPILYRGRYSKAGSFRQYIGPSAYTKGGLMEGVYVKAEDEEKVVGRLKLHHDGFQKGELVGPYNLLQNQLRASSASQPRG